MEQTLNKENTSYCSKMNNPQKSVKSNQNMGIIRRPFLEHSSQPIFQTYTLTTSSRNSAKIRETQVENKLIIHKIEKLEEAKTSSLNKRGVTKHYWTKEEVKGFTHF